MSGTQYGFDASVFFADFESENVAVKCGGPVDAGDGQEAHDGAFDPLRVAVIELGFSTRTVWKSGAHPPPQAGQTQPGFLGGPAQFGQAVLRKLSEVFEGCTLGELRIGALDTFLPKIARRPRVSGWKSGSLTEWMN